MTKNPSIKKGISQEKVNIQTIKTNLQSTKAINKKSLKKSDSLRNRKLDSYGHLYEALEGAHELSNKK